MVDFDDIAFKTRYMKDFTKTTRALGIDGPIPPKAYASGVFTLEGTRGQNLTEMTITVSACQKTFASNITELTTEDTPLSCNDASFEVKVITPENID